MLIRIEGDMGEVKNDCFFGDFYFFILMFVFDRIWMIIMVVGSECPLLFVYFDIDSTLGQNIMYIPTLPKKITQSK